MAVILTRLIHIIKETLIIRAYYSILEFLCLKKIALKTEGLFV